MNISLSFLIKKTLGLLILPSSIILFVFFLAILLYLRKKNKMLRESLLISGFFLFFIFSFPPVTYMLLTPLTDIKTDKTDHANIKSVAVLLAGVTYDYGQGNNHQLSPVSKIRLIKALDIANEKSLQKIYLSGGCAKPMDSCPVSEAEVAENFVRNKLKKTDIILETQSSDTFSNLQNLKKIIGDEPFYLVTSPSHLKRSMMIANHLNMMAYPVPSNNIPKPRWNLWTLWPSSENLYMTDMIFHEYYGIILFVLKEKL